MRRIFGAMNRRYLARAYLIGLAFFALIMGMASGWAEPGAIGKPMIGLLIVNVLLFPFAKLAWDELRDFILGDTVIIQSGIFYFVFKYLINGFLFALTTLIAPLGIAYLWFQTRGRAHGEQDPRSA